MPDLAEATARFGTALRAAGLPIGPDRTARFTESITMVDPKTTQELYWCALATLTSDPAHLATFDAVFDSVFRGMIDPADQRGQGPSAAKTPTADGQSSQPTRQTEIPMASPGERLSTRDFAELTPAELATLLHGIALTTPLRRSRRHHRAAHGSRVDLRASLRRARKTGGYPIHLERTRPRPKPRRLVVLCDISGSMQPYARAMLQLLYCATTGPRAETFTFATRLTRLTHALTNKNPAEALATAGQTAPDWSGGTRIGPAIKAFLRDHGRRGMARGAVILIISDGWEGGDPTELGAAMAELSRLAFRIVWANPRTAKAGYQPLAGGMAAAWPHCDAVVSAHRLDAIPELRNALADSRQHRTRTSRRLEI